jgi:cytoskeletal protein RodZ
VSDDPQRASIGEYLAQQRKLRGISVDELCEITKIPRRNIERLESGVLDGVSDGFMRGFVRTVAIALGLDPTEAVMRLMQEPEAERDPGPALLRFQHLRWLGIAIALLVLVLLWRAGSAWWASRPVVDETPELVHRLDAVGDLVRERQPLQPPEPAGAAAETDAGGAPDAGSEQDTPPPE